MLDWFPQLDFGVLEHGFSRHGRDYEIVVETTFGDPGRHRLTFTHVVEASVVTQVRDDVWPESWADVFIDYGEWERAGAPGGYVWGSNLSMAYPGIEITEPSAKAAAWAERLDAEMYEVSLTTDRFRLELIFHNLRTEKIDDRTDIVSQVIIPIPGE